MALEEGLDLFASEAYADVELDVDMKIPGYEREVAEGLERRGLIERSIVSSTYLESHDVLGRIAPDVRRGWSVPRAKRDYTRSPLAPFALLLARAGREFLPWRAAQVIEQGRCDGMMVHF